MIVLPTCTVPLEHLVRENWKKIREVGNFRRVQKISSVRNGNFITNTKGEKTALYVKSPEREFNIFHLNGTIWQNTYDRSEYTPYVYLRRDIRVEKQAVWEARILLGLAQNKISAEEPQAIVIHPDGKREVITKEIENQGSYISGTDLDSLRNTVLIRGFNPEDLHHKNVIVDKNGNPTIIDVNRWTWPPFTDKYQERLFAAVEEEIERKRNAKQPQK